jgi:branched-chain amino acid transport system permease protein
VSDKRLDYRAFGPAAGVLMFTAVGFCLDPYPQYVIAIALVSMLVGGALVLVVGIGRCITLAAGSITAIGAYVLTLAIVRLHLPYLAALALAAVAGAIAGWVIAVPGVRFRGHNLAMVTLVFQSVCIILLREATSLTGGAQGIRVPTPSLLGWNVVTDLDFVLLIGFFSALVVLLMTILVRGPFGKNLGAAATNELAAEAYGVSVPGYIKAAFVVSSIVIAVSGALAAPRVRILDPDSYGVMLSISMLAYPIIGGMHSIWGGLLGGGLMRVLPEMLRAFADYQELFFAALVLVTVMFFPGGLIELLRRATLVGRSSAKVTGEIARVPAVPAACARKKPPLPEGGRPLLVLKDVNKHFDALHAVNSASLTVTAGGLHGLIGPNGAGKTSLFNIISGFLDADSGHVAFDGASLLGGVARDRIGLGITRTFQNVAVFGQLSCLDNVIIGRGQNGVMHSMAGSFDYFLGLRSAAAARREAMVALESVGLSNEAGLAAGSLSLGNQRRLEIARAIVSNPRLIMLDEPVSGVAEAELDGLRELLVRINSERQIAMLVVEHNIPFVADLCRTMSVMGAGRIVAEGKPEDVLSLPLVRQLYFGEDVAS